MFVDINIAKYVLFFQRFSDKIYDYGILNDLSNFKKDKVFGALRHKLKDKRISLGLIII